MAIGGFLALLDDVATMMGKVAIATGDDIAAASKVVMAGADDVALMTKVASQRASTIITDDVALNANAVTGVDPKREYPIVLQIYRGSLLNKPVLVPLIVGINALYPPLLGPLLIAGGSYLAYEGAEKIYHALTHGKGDHDADHETLAMNNAQREKYLIKSAVKTDWVMSAEIITIGLSTMASYSVVYQLLALFILGLGISTLIYPVLVGGLVKIDDVGLHLASDISLGRHKDIKRRLGHGLVAAMPRIMKVISFVGTTAMFVVGGELIAHNIPALHHLIEEVEHATGEISALVAASVVGALVGAVLVKIVPLAQKLKKTLISH